MSLPDWLTVIPRPFPSATLVVVHGPRPIVIDPGSLTDADVLPGLLAGAGVPATNVHTVVCSHYHSDHVGAVAVLQATGAQVAAHAWDGAMVNARDPQVCAAKWLDQPVLPYRVDRGLTDGDVVSSGLVDLEVIHTPGHTLGGISLWEPDSRVLLCGDALHADDTPWIGSPHEGAGSLARAVLSLERIEGLDPALIVSGHGPLIADPAAAIERNRDRFERWAGTPDACAMHAAKRIFAYRLMLEPLAEDQVRDYLLRSPWLRDLSATTAMDAETFADQLLDGLARNLTKDDGLLATSAPHRPSATPIPWSYADPGNWVSA